MPSYCVNCPVAEVTVMPKFVTVSVLLVLLKVQGVNAIVSPFCGPDLY